MSYPEKNWNQNHCSVMIINTKYIFGKEYRREQYFTHPISKALIDRDVGEWQGCVHILLSWGTFLLCP